MRLGAKVREESVSRMWIPVGVARVSVLKEDTRREVCGLPPWEKYLKKKIYAYILQKQKKV